MQLVNLANLQQTILTKKNKKKTKKRSFFKLHYDSKKKIYNGFLDLNRILNLLPWKERQNIAF